MVDHHLFLLDFVVGMELAPVAVVVVQPAAVACLILQVYNSGFLGFLLSRIHPSFLLFSLSD